MIKNIKILDCTLRDGGYINNWHFGYDNIKKIINNLIDANIEIVECGYLTNKTNSDLNSSKFANIMDMSKLIPKTRKKTKFVCMINFGEYNIDDIPNNNTNLIYGIRVAFHRKDFREAVEFSRKLKEKNYEIFLQPMLTLNYDDSELLELINMANAILPNAFYIVDSFGNMNQEQMTRLFYLIHHNLDSSISIGFHSHNNLQLSYANSLHLLNLDCNRNLIIDSSIMGMGRGAGNLNTELFIKYLNADWNKNYDEWPLLKIIDEVLNKIYLEHYWGYSLPYYISAVNNCHPNYAMYLDNKQTLTIQEINKIIQSIPIEYKSSYNKVIIEDLYIKFLSKYIDDSHTIKYMQKILKNKDILVLAPGRSLTLDKDRIMQYISKNNPYIFSVNFIPENINVNCLFITNIKRFHEMDFHKINIENIICTSNVEVSHFTKKKTINYANYLNKEADISDNAGFIILNFLKQIGMKKVSVAGFDGYNVEIDNNYYKKDLKNAVDIERKLSMNRQMHTALNELSNNFEIKFLTKSIYKTIK